MKIIKTSQFDQKSSEPVASSPEMGGSIPGGVHAPKLPFDEVMDLDGMEDIEDALQYFIGEIVANHISTESDGIGDYEFWGQKSFDKGETHSTLEGFTVGVHITGTPYADDPEMLPTHLSGMSSIPSNDEYTDHGDIDWNATLSDVKEIGGKRFAVYQVS